ncbi:hypothetical protein BJ508DRAFT_414241 [Ascobolus immersus RN42]|uniref:DUF4326 domain-containing protein n=1 Tax=Ascobolus immersus RN42 TaxID=1160509 RepID=A0A3N4IKM3_ASCIM|nr:hypothetical protein BJ508DRAFT_414241 [Ascobolus immersus RN42]
MPIRVVSKRRTGTQPHPHETVIYIGRPSPLGNPFPLHQEAQRAEVVEKYDAYLKKAYGENAALREELHRIAGKVKAGESVAVQCWCSPLKCHGDVVVKAVEWIVREGQGIGGLRGGE